MKAGGRAVRYVMEDSDRDEEDSAKEGIEMKEVVQRRVLRRGRQRKEGNHY